MYHEGENTKGRRLFYAQIPVVRHVSKKNGRPVYNGRICKSPELKAAENHLLLQLQSHRNYQKIFKPFGCDLWLLCIFKFDDYYTKKGVRRKNLPDLSNLYELIQDQLQNSGIIENDSQICSHDRSRREPGNQNILEISLYEFIE